MENLPPQHLQVLSQLAREYHEKYAELENTLKDAGPDELLQQLKAYSEMTTDRFRAVQQLLLEKTAPDAGGDEQSFKAATAFCRCFDEMRILFQFLLERSTLCNREKV